MHLFFRTFELIAVIIFVCGCTPSNETNSVVRAGNTSPEKALVAADGDWPWWRGPNHNGVAEPQAVPHHWDENKNILWKVPIPGRGHASPIVVEDRIFLTTADNAEETMSLLCLDRASGKTLWEKTIHAGQFMHTHKKNSHASATPAWDGRFVFVVFMVDNGIFVTALDKDGTIQWKKKAGPFDSKHGYGSSPVLYQSMIIINGDNQGSGFLTAMDRETGEMVWRIDRTDNSSFCTPIVTQIDGVDQLLLSGHNEVSSYNPANGQLRWKSRGPAATTANTMGWHQEVVFASGGWPEHNLMAVRADGSGEIVWEKGIKAYVPSPLVINDRLIVTQDANIVRCYDPQTGKELWVERLGRRGYSASPTAVGEIVYLPDETGNVHVFRAGDKFKSIASNKLPGDGMASPVICDSRIYLRTLSHLYCIAEAEIMGASIFGDADPKNQGSGPSRSR